MKPRVLILVGLGVILMAGLALLNDGADGPETAPILAQGGGEPAVASEGARLTRNPDGLRIGASIPTPEPGSYEYPSGDMTPPWAPAHPEVRPGGPGEPEVFTLWLFVFNHPDLCTDGSCDLDDLSADADAKGGSYQLDGRIADGDVLDLAGAVRVGQPSMNGAVLEDPFGAEVHVAVAPHGRAHDDTNRWAQLNGPVGNPTLWWAATFLP